MIVTEAHNVKVAKLSFNSVYPHYLKKIVNKGRSESELFTVISWLTGFDDEKIKEFIVQNISFLDFFKLAKINPNAKKISGLICGYRIEDIENELTRNVRYLDKLVDELAKGKKMEKILRS